LRGHATRQGDPTTAVNEYRPKEQTMMIPRLDYCNTALAGLPQATVAPLQRVQNSINNGSLDLQHEQSSARHLITATVALWLPVRWHVQFNLCWVMHSVFYGMCPSYLTNIVESAGAGCSVYVPA